MITEDYVSFETAKLLKEKGFDENTPVNYFVGDDKPRGCMVGEMIYHKRLEEDTHLIACPTHQMAMKWLREVHDLHIIAYPWKADREEKATHWCCRVYKSFNHLGYEKYTDETPKSYEEACEAGIVYCLENLI